MSVESVLENDAQTGPGSFVGVRGPLLAAWCCLGLHMGSMSGIFGIGSGIGRGICPFIGLCGRAVRNFFNTKNLFSDFFKSSKNLFSDFFRHPENHPSHAKRPTMKNSPPVVLCQFVAR